jgi:hypothetical protein
MSGVFIFCIKELHDFARQIFASTVTWFTVFVTVNYASMGWLASKTDFETTPCNRFSFKTVRSPKCPWNCRLRSSRDLFLAR